MFYFKLYYSQLHDTHFCGNLLTSNLGQSSIERDDRYFVLHQNDPVIGHQTKPKESLP